MAVMLNYNIPNFKNRPQPNWKNLRGIFDPYFIGGLVLGIIVTRYLDDIIWYFTKLFT